MPLNELDIPLEAIVDVVIEGIEVVLQSSAKDRLIAPSSRTAGIAPQKFVRGAM